MNIRSTLECFSFILFSCYSLPVHKIAHQFSSHYKMHVWLPFVSLINNFIKKILQSSSSSLLSSHFFVCVCSLIFSCCSFFFLLLFVCIRCSLFCLKRNFDEIFLPPLSSFFFSFEPQKKSDHNVVCWWKNSDQFLCYIHWNFDTNYTLIWCFFVTFVIVFLSSLAIFIVLICFFIVLLNFELTRKGVCG